MTTNEAALKLARQIAPVEWCKNQIVLDAMVAAILEVTERAAGLAEATKSYDDHLQRSSGCATSGQRFAIALRQLEHLS